MTDLWPRIEPLLPHVERPSRYIGSEWIAGAAPDDGLDAAHMADAAPLADGLCESDELSFCMVYPDTYELGQPNQAVRILANAVNATPGLRAERAYLPAVDMIELMRQSQIPAFSLESCSPLSEFDVIGITLPHELCATNVLELIDLAGVPVRSCDRSDDDPIIIAGGPCVCNPEPYAAFFDAITVGEGEEATPETLLAIRDMRRRGLSRAEILRGLVDVSGTYVPSLYRELFEDEAIARGSWVAPECDGVPEVILKRVFKGFSESSAWEAAQVPYMEIVHDRLNVEVLRGCARGCRFCQAGMMYRPVRERSADNIVESVIRGLEETGYEEVSLTSLSSTDHSQIGEILTRLNRELSDKGVRVSVPSQRLDSFGVEMASLVAGRKKGGLTFAPEAGTQRLRDVINKNVTDDDLMNAASSAMAAGWRRMKLYFMIGLPTETDDDLLGIADMCNRAYACMKEATPADQRGNLRLGVSINVFVPKAQTPFQWDGQIASAEAARRVSIIKGALKSKAITVSYHEPKTSLLEGVMSRGGREVANLIEAAWRRGARFDAWSEHFNSDAWEKAALECGMDMAAISEESYESSHPMPWAHISYGADLGFLASERERALAGEVTPDCTFDACSNCGVCPSHRIANQIAGER